MKKGIIVILIIILTTIAGVLVPVLMNKDSDNLVVNIPGGATSKPKTTAVTTTNEIDPQNTNVNNNETPSTTVVPKYTSDISLDLSTPTVTPGKGESEIGGTTPEPDTTLGMEDLPTPAKTNKNSAGSWVDRKIEEHRDEIDSDDLADFRRIYSSVDIGYIQGLMEDGLDDEETSQLKAYLRSTLGGDYERAKELFYKYSYLLSEV